MDRAVGSAGRVTVPRVWPGETCVCLAGGPSLTREDVDSVRGKARVIAVNNAYQLAPWADVLYAADFTWWGWHRGVPDFAGLKYGMVPRRADCPDVQCLRIGDTTGLSLDPTTLCTGKNSGYQAINLAVLLGATRILLLGYDLKHGQGGRQHWHADHPRKTPASELAGWVGHFATLVAPLKQAGVSVVNCTRSTALHCFPEMPIEQALPAREVAA